MLPSLSPTVLALLRFGVDVVLKVTVVLVAAEILWLLLRRAPAALRHAVLMLALAGVLFLPVLTLLVPRWQVPLVPSLLPESTETSPVEQASARFESVAALPIEEDRLEAGETSAPSSTSESSTGASSAPAVPPQSLAPSSRPLAWTPWILALWALGAGTALARLLVGSARVAAMARRAVRVWDLEWVLAKEELSARLGLVRPVQLLASDRVPVAMTYGARRPLLLVAANAERWTPERRRVVLLHELAHVARRDWILLLVAEIARAIYWFHPLVWVAVGQARRDCEKACDDIVLGSGTKPSVYAAHLLGIVRALQATRQQLLPAVPMARPSQFEGRMRAILDAGRSRRGLSRLEKTLAIAGVSVAVLGAAAVEPWAKCPEQRAAFFSRAEIAPIAALLGLVPVSAGNPEKTAQPQVAPKRSCPSSAAPAAVPAIYPSNPARNSPEAPLRAENLLEEISDAVEDGGKAGVAPGIAGGVAPGIRGGIEGGVPGGVEGGVRGGVEGFQKASRKEGRSGSSWFSRGKELHDEGRYAEAIEAFRRSIDMGYREGTSSYNIACGYARLGRSSEAMEWLQRAMDAGFDVARYIGRDDDLDSLRNLPAFRELKRKLKSGDAAAAEQELERLSHRPAARGSAFYETGKRLLSADSYEAAARAFQQSAESGYRVGTSLYNQACARSLADQREEALVLLEKSLLAGFDDVGLLRRDTDLENVRSEKRYNEIVRLAEDLSLSLPAGSWDAFGYVKHRWRKELPRYQEVAARHPQIGRAWSNLGLAQLRTEDYGGAERAFEKALALGYRKPTTMYNLACAHAVAGEKDRAFDWLFQALNAGFDGSHLIRHDSDLDHIRRDPRFREALEKAEQQKVAEKN